MHEISQYLTLPRQPSEMVEFIQDEITKAVTKGTPPKVIIQAIHDYTCQWLTAMAKDDSSKPLPIETDKRYN